MVTLNSTAYALGLSLLTSAAFALALGMHGPVNLFAILILGMFCFVFFYALASQTPTEGPVE